mmetsp:Transcript_16697/g.30368  ORF Transcript_16697/g.30368 Transcript_16697/m.30368 type:complete len:531 (-) Transcript_16697:231-1823(-)|eukprot:CAMPEP_0198283492 /NCGR_PEP_ID=MMETSP1449-20131203/3069_1 /TAXON_ID=420275 /ORGANISM="Attheya septentrionalis, Strain CCMP2084" /LENGTH=530 /DNA_ID=CAMNT_0043980119 /DNA_START=219 /DNA_END=1811 /DNA_ORIENTATION=-
MTEKKFRVGVQVSLIKRLRTTTVIVGVLAFILAWQILFFYFLVREVPNPDIRLTESIIFPEHPINVLDDDMVDPSIEILKHGNSVGSRIERFPTVEKRVKLYMSNWYNPVCDANDKFQYPPNLGLSLCILDTAAYLSEDHSDVIEFFSTVKNGVVFFVDRVDSLEICFEEGIGSVRRFCEDTLDLYKAMQQQIVITSAPPPLLLRFGDGSTSRTQGNVQIPHFTKIRPATLSSINAHEEIERVTTNVTTTCPHCIPTGHPRSPLNTGRSVPKQVPIIWNMNKDRFYGDLGQIPGDDIEWSEKKNVAVFRGALTGCNRHSFSKKVRVYDQNNISSEDCMSIMRCRIALKYSQSELIDAKITSAEFSSPYGKGTLPQLLDGAVLVGNGMSRQELLHHKVLIVLAGNELASGLAWSLLSKSVVFMQTPQYTSWLMEESLDPWIHYIPITKELTDLEEKMKWVMEHDTEARHIAERGTLWVYDLLFHDDADKDDELVKIEMAHRYMAHFQVNTSDSILCPEGTVEPEDDDDDEL